MNILGIEATAHTFGAGIVTDQGRILANEKDTFTTKEGGMVPIEVAKHHEEVADKIIEKALKTANLTDIDLIAYSRGPGLSPCLLVGLRKARELSENIPIIGVNHCVAHLTIGDLVCKTKDPVYLYVSGVNTQVIALAGKRFRIFGETLDIGLGNALDKFGRSANLGFPAGPKIEQLAKKGKYLELPYAVKGMDVSFAGMITKAERLLTKEKIEDLCCSIQETAFAMLAEVAERAMAHCNKSELVLIGGVAANKRLCQMLETMCKERNAKFCAVPLDLAGDQGAMIAWQGFLEYNAGR
ncbi:tRNA (adenosine(37)-N6)-threonylcarbamoyltransferase complex transferase subunit TsaD, partial [Candidatus Woesearchaeota archaeon]|nr:tRNA (adenosine(37)-N6)-threonylcarbamoyltransferase complex transferase subunit TsaD [Candidatus Woesearchaeota archaeon]